MKSNKAFFAFDFRVFFEYGEIRSFKKWMDIVKFEKAVLEQTISELLLPPVASGYKTFEHG